ncbi:phospholipase A [Ectothiorhodospira lacustris]|uniref:phospholipase A n=1 Tax=Ectothiorhodospira lacustris TaxID=2899127 RepID=UPI001EE781E0|nr:phospholipase A [Ectothiorhodospira lacustris]MCG5508983.1 phospholipase A [Ectothiorhodospira lacustris]MCG5520774.1 phospholipase A [Ectothiorhodospira lacustris]
MATPLAEALQSCTGITDDLARLACYDRLAEQPVADGDGVSPPPSRILALPGGEAARDLARVRRPASHIDTAWGFAPDSSRYVIASHRPSYLLPARYTDRPNEQPFSPLMELTDADRVELDSVEAKFQFSFKTRLWASEDRRWGLWGAYTQQSQWQVYNDRDGVSRPFRETNYMPELILSYRPDLSLGGFHWRLLNVGYNHQSNGRAEPLSRSWDRLFAEVAVERDDLVLSARLWHRVQESGNRDDNPDITDYLGYGDLTAFWRRDGHSYTLMLRGRPSTGKGAVQATWMTPPVLGPLRAYAQVFSGYGESMIDYNWRQNTLGFGLALSDLY